MRKLLVIITFIFITFISFSDITNVLSANGECVVSFDKRTNKINSFNDICGISKNIIRELEIGCIINNKFYKIKDFNPKISYIEGTNIIKISGEIEKIEINIFIYTSYEIGDKSFYVGTEIKTNEIKEKKDVKMFYYIDSKYDRSRVYFDDLKKVYIENDILIKSVKNKTNFYITTDDGLRDLKLKKLYDKIDKGNYEKMLLVTDLGKIDRYEERKDAIVISMEKEIDENIESYMNSYLETEMDNWSYWSRNLVFDSFNATEKKLLKQNIVFLRMMQMKNGALVNILGEGEKEIKTADLILAAKAFLKIGQYMEAKLIISFILNKKTEQLNEEIGSKYLVSSYGYECEDYTEKVKKIKNSKYVSYYNMADFLVLISDYISISSDSSLLKENYKRITEELSDVIYSKIEDGLMEADGGIEEAGWENREHFLLTQYMSYNALNKFIAQVRFFAPKGLVDKYSDAVLKLRNYTETKFVGKDGVLIHSLEDKNDSPFDMQCFLGDFISNKDTFNRSINQYFSKYKVKDSDGLTSEPLSNKENIELDMLLITLLYKNGYNAKADSLKKRIEELALKNQYILPKIISGGKYIGDDISLRITAQYINMLYNKYE